MPIAQPEGHERRVVVSEAQAGRLVDERSLARATGVSQPHMHNVLKGTRLLSVDTSDQILKNLDMDVLDLIE